MVLKIIYVVSPDYLESIFQESEKYSFEIQGYGSFTAASKGLIYTNAADVLGFAYMTERFPLPGSSNYRAFMEFAKMCCLMDADKKFVIVTKSFPKGAGKQLAELKALRFTVYVEKDLVTDITINRNLFGSILLDNYEPYCFKEEGSSIAGDYGCTVLKIPEVVPPYLFEVFEPIHLLGTEEDSISSDTVVMRYREDLGNPLVLLRIIAILVRMGHDGQVYHEKFLERIKLMSDKRYGLYLAALKMVEGAVQYEN